MPHPKDPQWKAAGSGMTDDEMRFMAGVLKNGPKDPVLGRLVKQWNDLWEEWESVGKTQANLERRGVGGTEVDTLFKARLEPKIKRFQATFADVMGHLTTVANK